MAVFCAPGERVEACVDGASGAATMVKIDRAQSNYGAEGALPRERGKLHGQFGIWLELHSVGAGSFLKLVDHERADEADTVGAKMPAAGIAVRDRGKTVRKGLRVYGAPFSQAM